MPHLHVLQVCQTMNIHYILNILIQQSTPCLTSTCSRLANSRLDLVTREALITEQWTFKGLFILAVLLTNPSLTSVEHLTWKTDHGNPKQNCKKCWPKPFKGRSLSPVWRLFFQEVFLEFLKLLYEMTLPENSNLSWAPLFVWWVTWVWDRAPQCPRDRSRSTGFSNLPANKYLGTIFGFWGVPWKYKTLSITAYAIYLTYNTVFGGISVHRQND